jgi:HD-like signal output (HDOD) protein
MTQLAAFFETVKLPSMSEVAHALIQSLNDDSTSVPHIRDLIAKDPALSAKLLRLANSAQFGLPRGVSSLDDAISMVGMSKVRTLALGACLSEAFPDIPGLDRQEFWRTSMACAGYAQWLATGLGMDGQQAWLTGMMLRLGELLIVQAEPDVLQEIEKLPHIPGVRWQREARLTGFTEGQITSELARRWNFPPQMVQALAQSAEPVTTHGFSRLAGILHLAGLMAETDHNGPEVIDTLPTDVLGALMLDIDWLHAKFPQEDSFVNITHL